MITLAIFKDPNIDIIQSLVISLIAILIVFLILIILILVCSAFEKGISKVTSKTKILPKEENKILDEDEDSVAAILAATIDFYKETGKEPVVKSVKRIEE